MAAIENPVELITLSSGGNWRRGSGSNRRIKVLQTSPLPLGYRAFVTYTRSTRHAGHKNGLVECTAAEGCFWSGRPGSNRRHLPWQGSTLPLSYSRPAKVSIAEVVLRMQSLLCCCCRVFHSQTFTGDSHVAGTHDMRCDGDQ